MNEATPAFIAAMTTVMELADVHGHAHPLVQTALMLAQELAPPTFKAFMYTEAENMGLIPDADGYLDDGTPVYRLEAMAAKLGVPESEIQASVQAFMADRAALGLDTTPIDPALIHRIQ
jgi:hypothetical protein